MLYCTPAAVSVREARKHGQIDPKESAVIRAHKADHPDRAKRRPGGRQEK